MPRKNPCSTLSKIIKAGLFFFSAASYVQAATVNIVKTGGTLTIGEPCGNTVVLDGKDLSLKIDQSSTNCIMGNGEFLDYCSGDIKPGAKAVTVGYKNKSLHPIAPGTYHICKGLQSSACKDGLTIYLHHDITFEIKEATDANWLKLTRNGILRDMNTGKKLLQLKQNVDYSIVNAQPVEVSIAAHPQANGEFHYSNRI